jgi:hypothetical protein
MAERTGWLSRLKEWATRDPVGRVDDDRLGPLILNDGGTDGCWVARVTVQSRPVRFEIGGRYEPDAMLIRRAHDILASFDRFAAEVATFLADEAARPEWQPFAAEIRALAIRDICLFWPDQHDDGMIFFDGPDECRCWRCDLIERVPVGLGFDS